MPFEPQPFGKYYLLERIASGGMAEIYKAKTFGAVGFEKLLAIKRILPHLSQNSEFINMLIDEAKIAVQLSHMNIVQVFDLGKIDNDYFIAMEYIHGYDLRTIMRILKERGERMSVENAVYIIVEICKGLDYAHRKRDQFGLPSGIVHRDISPQNVLISTEGEVKIVDFGIAKASRKVTETDAGVLKGKFAYMSPEQARGEEVDQRTDIFSTAILLYEILTGERLFYQENNIKTLETIKNFAIEPPFLPPDIPSELEYILMQALQNRPEERYQSANDFQVDLTKFLYSSALDFTSKNLADLMERLREEGEEKPESPKSREDLPLDTQTRQLISRANQEVLVSRQEEFTPAGDYPRLPAAPLTRFSSKKKRSAPPPRELFEEASNSRWFLRGGVFFSVAFLLFLIFLMRHEVADRAHRFFQRESAVLPGQTKGADLDPKVVKVNGSFTSVYVETEPPGARVYLDGKEGPELTPVLLKGLESGQEHALLLSKQNYESVWAYVRGSPGEILKVNKKLKREEGTLFVDSKPPGAKILLNGERVGETPYELKGVPAHVDLAVQLSKEGYQTYFEVVQVKPNNTALIKADLRRGGIARGAVQIRSVPQGAKIRLDGLERREKTPQVIKNLEVDREYRLVLHLEGYQDYSQAFRVRDGETTPIEAYLKALPEKIE